MLRNTLKRHVDINTEEKQKTLCFNTFMFDHTLHCEKKNILTVIVYKLLAQKKY